LTPITIELQAPPYRLLIRFETSPLSTEAQIAEAARLCAGYGATTAILAGQAEADAWTALERGVSGDLSSGTRTTVKLAVLPTDVGEMLSRAEAAAAEHRMQYAAIGRAALGIVIVRVDGNTSGQAAFVSELRQEAVSRAGSAVLLSGPSEVGARLGAWGPIADTAPLMRAVKARFDPRGLLNRGREPWESVRP
jgi:FAD/FMN-containing dehydrogenase